MIQNTKKQQYNCLLQLTYLKHSSLCADESKNVYFPKISKLHSMPVRVKDNKYKEKTAIQLPSATYS